MEKLPNNFFNIEEMGFFRAAAVSPVCSVANIDANKTAILEEIKKAATLSVNLILFPQLIITSASAGSLFNESFFIDKAFTAVSEIAEHTKNLRIIAAIGFPFFYRGRLYSAQAIIHNGGIKTVVPLCPPKQLSSFFSSLSEFTGGYIEFTDIIAETDCVFNVHAGKTSFSFVVTDTNNAFCASWADFMLLPLAEPSYAFSSQKIKETGKTVSRLKNTASVFANCGTGESSGDFVFAGETGIFECGTELQFASALDTDSKEKAVFSFCDIDTERIKKMRISALPNTLYKYDAGKKQIKPFLNTEIHLDSLCSQKTLHRTIEQNPFLPVCDEIHKHFIYSNYYQEIIHFQILALAKRLTHIGCTKCVIGISGGSDSTLTLLSALKCFDFLHIPHENLYAVNMSGFGTTEQTKNNAVSLASLLGCTVLQIPITKAVEQHFVDIGQDAEKHDTVFENAQARERTQILMDKANQIGGIMLGTGDLSEAALGWTTYNGDHISMYELNSSIPKTLLKGCIKEFAENGAFFSKETDSEKAALFKKLINDILATPISPELLPLKNGKISQKTESIVGTYELHDFFLYHIIKNGASPKKVFFIALEAFAQKYSKKEIFKTLQTFYKRFFSQQFKRSCSADGADVTGFSLSPRTAWCMASDSAADLWLKELETLSKIV